MQILGQEDSLEGEMATYSHILAWKILWTEKPVGYSPCHKESDTESEQVTSNQPFYTFEINVRLMITILVFFRYPLGIFYLIVYSFT